LIVRVAGGVWRGAGVGDGLGRGAGEAAPGRGEDATAGPWDGCVAAVADADARGAAGPPDGTGLATLGGA
jgi:hypothetical protein